MTTEMITFPTLYKKDNKNKIRQWNIYVVHKEGSSEIYTKYGVVDGKLIETKPTIINKGKNIGKSNETTIQQQSILQAESIFTKKKEKELYKEVLPNENDDISEKEFRPMLATTYEFKDNSKVKFPKYIQPKLDGARCVAQIKEGKVYLKSRTGKEFYNFNHIREKILELNIPENIILDGELGCFGKNPKLSFQQSVGLIKRKQVNEQNPEEFNIEYHVYDLYDENNTGLKFEDRWNYLKELVKHESAYVKLCCPEDLTVVKNLEDVIQQLEYAISEQFEGLMLRDKNGIYEQDKRSKFLCKCKKFDTNEFEIIGFKEGEGNFIGTIIFICKNEYGTFDPTPIGSIEERKKMFQNGESYIGKLLTVKHFGYTDKNIPRFPNAITVRDYE